MQAAEDLRITLNSGRVFLPLFRAVLIHPGLHANQGAFDSALSDVLKLHSEVVTGVKARIAPEDNHPSVRAMIARPVAELVADAWDASEGKASAIDVKRIVDLYCISAALPEPIPENAFERDVDVAIQNSLALGKAVCLAMGALAYPFGLGKDQRRLYLSDLAEQDASDIIADTISRAAEETVSALIPKGDEQTQSIVYRSAVAVFGDLYRTLIETHFDLLTAELQSLKKDEQRDYLDEIDRNPDGILIDRVEIQFQEMAPRIYKLPSRAHGPAYEQAHSQRG